MSRRSDGRRARRMRPRARNGYAATPTTPVTSPDAPPNDPAPRPNARRPRPAQTSGRPEACSPRRSRLISGHRPGTATASAMTAVMPVGPTPAIFNCRAPSTMAAPPASATSTWTTRARPSVRRLASSSGGAATASMVDPGSCPVRPSCRLDDRDYEETPRLRPMPPRPTFGHGTRPGRVE